MNGINVQNSPAFQTSTGSHNVQQSSAQVGSRDGQRVIVQNSGSQGVRSQDLEELSMSIASKRDRKDVGKEGPRRIETQASRQIQAIEKINEQLDKLQDFDKQAMQRLLQSLKREPPSDGDDLQRRLGDFHEDISYQQIALGVMAGQLDQEGDQPSLLQQINQQIGKNEREFGKEIRAGVNITGTAINSAKGDAAQIQELRGAYRQNILSFEGVRKTFVNLIKGSNANEPLAGRIQFLTDAISAELNAQGPSIEKRYLQAIRDEIYQLVSLNSLRERLGRSLERYIKRFGKIRLRKQRRQIGRADKDEDNAETNDPNDWLLLMMLELGEASFVSANQVDEKTNLMSPPSIEAEIYLLREICEFSRGVAEKVYPSPEHRFRLIDACQQALDGKIEREEEMEE